ncbi:MAG TPA: amidohydrolase family protein, partial [Abditibacterium sp.]
MAAPSIFDACALFGPWPQHEDLALQNLLDVMGQSNIARSVALSTAGIFYDFRAGNAATFEAARAHAQQILPAATLDPRAYPACLEEAKRCAAQGVRLFRFFPYSQGWPLKFAPFRELLQLCNELNVTVAVEVSRAGDATELADAVAFTAAPLLLAGVAPRNLGEALAVTRSSPKFHLETTQLLAPGSLESIVAEVPDGADRLIFASYSPLRYLSAALGPVLASTLSPDQKTAVLGGNLKRLLTK